MATAFHNAILAKDWNRIAEMIRPYCETSTLEIVNGISFIDWLREDEWGEPDDRFPTPEVVAKEWDEFVQAHQL